MHRLITRAVAIIGVSTATASTSVIDHRMIASRYRIRIPCGIAACLTVFCCADWCYHSSYCN